MVHLVFLSFFSFWAKDQPSCFSESNFDSVLKYVRWKQGVSKIGKVMAEGYEVQINEADELVFKDKSYSLFVISRAKGITLLSVKNNKRLERKANKAFCSLLEYARFRNY